MKQSIIDSLEHCPACGCYYTDDDAGCQCPPVSDDIKRAQMAVMKQQNVCDQTVVPR